MCRKLMSKRKMLIVCLILLFTTLLTLPVRVSKVTIDQYPIYSINDFKNELKFKNEPLLDSDLPPSDSLDLSSEIAIEGSELNSTNYFYSSEINGIQKQHEIDLTAIDPSAFASTWNTSLITEGSTGSRQVRLPLEESGTYNFNADWGDGTNDTITTWNQVEVTHAFPSEGVYTIIIEGTLVGWRFNNGGDRLKIIEISQWGNISLGNSDSYFYGSSNLELTAIDSLDLAGTTTLRNAFRNSGLVESGNLNSWDVSSVTDMSSMFYDAFSFNQSISNWDVSSVIDMSFMFGVYVPSVLTPESPFNQDISNWDVSSVTNMSQMFIGATSFNQPIGNWDVSSVTDMNQLFYGAFSFNYPISNWDVSNVTDMSFIFALAFSFNQPINNWDVSSVTDMSWMFRGAISFNQPIGNWDVSSVTDMSGMFTPRSSTIYGFGLSPFNQDISSWDVSSVTDMSQMFRAATSFNQPIGNWDVSSVTDMSWMFKGVTLSTSNYDTLLQGWSELSLQLDVTFDAGNSINSDVSADARKYIIDEFNWIIYDATNPLEEETNETQTEETSETQTEKISETQTEEISESLDKLIIGGSFVVFLLAGLGGYMLKVSALPRINGNQINESTKKMLQRIFNGNTNKYLYLFGGFTGKDNIKTETNIPKEMLKHKLLMQPVRLAMMKVLTENPFLTNIEMKNTLGISWADFTNNLIALRKHNLVLTEEKFIDGVTKQTITVTPEGLSKYNQLVEALQEFLASPDYDLYAKGYPEDILKESESN